MKKFVSVLLIVALLLQQVIFVNDGNPVFATFGDINIGDPTTGGIIIPRIKPTPTPVLGDLTHVDPTPTPILSDPTHVDPTPTPVLSDPTHVDATPTGNTTNNNNTTTTTNTSDKVDPSSFSTTLTASKYPSKPKDPDAGYIINDKVFIDWNTKVSTWWFKCDFYSTMPDNIVYQVSMVPFSGNDKDLYNTLGLLKQDTLCLNNDHEFFINFANLLPRKENVTKNFSSPELVKAVAQGISAPEKSTTKQRKSNKSFQNSALSLIDNLKKQNAARFKAALQKNMAAMKDAASMNRSKIIADKNPEPVKSDFQATPELTVTAERELLEANCLPTTLHKFYVRYFAVDNKYKPVGDPSNSITVYYGEPAYEGLPDILPNSVEGYCSDKSFEYSKEKKTMYLKWSATPRPTCIVKFYIEDVPHDNYQYTYYQVIKGTTEPIIDKDNINNPEGLVATYKSFQQRLDLDVLKFVPKMNLYDNWVQHYYIRAIHVYSDYDNPCYVKLAVSPAVSFIYGNKPGGEGTLKVPDNPISGSDINIDIGTPYIRFVHYTAPFFGSNPSDHIVVKKTPSGAFSWLKPGEKRRLSDLKNWLEIKKSEAPFLEQTFGAFGSLFSILVDLVNSISSTWANIQKFAADCLNKVGVPESIGGFLINAALVAVGIPPSLPNFDELSNMGVAYLAETIVQQSGGYIPEDIANKAANELVKQAKNAANATLSDLPDGLDDLEGCIQLDPDFMWKPATVTIELYNPYENDIPSGEFNLSLGDKAFNTERITYPALKAGKKMNMTICLDEVPKHWIKNGEKKFNTVYWYSDYMSEWDKVTAKGQHRIGGGISNLTPHIPENLTEWMSEIGLKAENGQTVSFNIINNQLQFGSSFNKVSEDWNSNSDIYPSVLYVAPAPFGNDLNKGTERRPLRTLAKAVSMADEGSVINLYPGSYSVDNLQINRSDISIIGMEAGVSLNAKPNSKYALQFNKIPCVVKNMTVNGGIKGAWELDNVVVKNTLGIGIDGVARVYNCEVYNTGLGKQGLSCGIFSAVEVVNCKVHDIPGEGIVMGADRDDFSKFSSASGFEIRNCEVYNCTTGIYLNGINSKIENCNIYKSKKGIMLLGVRNHISNCFIHFMYEFGVGYFKSDACGMNNCTLLDTTIPVYFIADKEMPNKNLIDNETRSPSAWFAENCIMAQSFIGKDEHDINSEHGLMVYVENNENGFGLVPGYQPYMCDNIYYCYDGDANFMDCRQGSVKNNMAYNGNFKDENGLDMWPGYAGNFMDRKSKELDPKLDSRGHSSLTECEGMGVQ